MGIYKTCFPTVEGGIRKQAIFKYGFKLGLFILKIWSLLKWINNKFVKLQYLLDSNF